jgi:hypothetical protein
MSGPYIRTTVHLRPGDPYHLSANTASLRIGGDIDSDVTLFFHPAGELSRRDTIDQLIGELVDLRDMLDPEQPPS